MVGGWSLCWVSWPLILFYDFFFRILYPRALTPDKEAGHPGRTIMAYWGGSLARLGVC